MKTHTASGMAAAVALCIAPLASLASALDEQKSAVIAQFRTANETGSAMTASAIDDQKSVVIAQYRIANEAHPMIADQSTDQPMGSFNSYLMYLGQRIRADAGSPGQVI